jgi:hypothetical protein
VKITQQKIFFSIIVLLVFGAIASIIIGGTGPIATGKYDSFAICLKDKGAVFYGTFWCSHCQSEKKLFGSSKKLLPYVECSTSDMQDQTQVCKDNKIEGYPTWTFADGSTLRGEVSLATLAQKTSCVLPE